MNTQPDNTQFELSGFEAFGLAPTVLKTLAGLGFDIPTPIQREAIPLVLDGHDVLGLAQTGTGKTAAFGLPLIDKLMSQGSKPEPRHVRALILAPTRELTNQITANLKAFVRNTHLSVTSVVGGQSINAQQRTLARGNDILVATPGRLLDLIERKAVTLEKARFLVLDEADQMLDLGFIHALKRISKLVAKQRQTMLFSATMPKAIEELAQAFLSDPVRVQVSPPGKAADKVTQSVYHVDRRNKPGLLAKLLSENPDDLSLVFARTKHGAEKLMNSLVEKGFSAGSIHGNKSQGQRDRAIKALKSGEIRILVATDVAARGIDISGITHVYNFDLPEVAANYVHRIGRTARAGAEGKAVAFCAPDELNLLKAIEKEMKMPVPIQGEAFTAAVARQGAQEAKEIKENETRQRQNRKGGGRGRPGARAEGAGGGAGRGKSEHRGKRGASTGPVADAAPKTDAKQFDKPFAKSEGRNEGKSGSRATPAHSHAPADATNADRKRNGPKQRWKRSEANGSKFRKRNAGKGAKTGRPVNA